VEFNLADLWEAVVDAEPEREALVRGDVRRTFGEVEERSNRLAHAFADRGIGPGDHVAVDLRNRPEYVETMLAAFKLRAVPVNVNYRYVADELRYLLDDAHVKLAVVAEEFAAVVDDVRADLPRLQTLVTVRDSPVGSGDASPSDWERANDEYESILATSSPERDFGPRSGDDPYIVYTGGTTGMPKGVIWRSEDIFFAGMGGGNPAGRPCTRPEEIVDHLERPIRALPACPLMHGTANWIAFRVLYGGGAVVMFPDAASMPPGSGR
jgi:3-oxocholest-4-en-26-oate---CoA ligase